MTSSQKKEERKQYYQKNKDRIYASHRTYIYNHSESRKAYLKKYWQDPKNQQRRRELYRLRIDHYKKRDRAHYYATRDRHRELYISKKYGISVEEYRGLFERQKSLCGICNLPERAKNRVLAVDHDHKTGRVRGLLCAGCNKAVGHVKDDIRILKNMLSYLENVKTS